MSRSRGCNELKPFYRQLLSDLLPHPHQSAINLFQTFNFPLNSANWRFQQKSKRVARSMGAFHARTPSLRSNVIDNVAVYRDGVTKNTYFLFASELPSLHLPCTRNKDPRSAFSKIETFWRILWHSDRTSSSLQMSFTCENVKRVIV